jgi:flagellar assembly protein FliH
LSKVLKLHGNVWPDPPTRKIPAVPARLEERAEDESLPSPPAGQGIEDAAAVDVQAEAESVLAAAREEAERIVAEAMLQAEQLRQTAMDEGRREGYEQGLQEGRTAAEEQYQRRLQAVEELLQDAKAQRVRLVQSLHEPLVAVCMTAVRQLLKRELETKPADIHQMVADILAEAVACTKAEVRVHPDDYPHAVESHPVLQSARFGGFDVMVVPDSRIERGGCEVRFDSGRADATVGTKLAMLQETLAAYVERSVNEYVDAHLG